MTGPRVSHVTLIQVARMLGVARQSVLGRIARGEMESIDFAGEPMVAVRDVEAWRKERTTRLRGALARSEA